METHDLEIEIGKDGKVRVRTEGAKGKSCLEYVKLLQQLVGTIQSQELTAEYYEPDSQVKLAPPVRQHERRQG
jgi:hypothetical protein